MRKQPESGIKSKNLRDSLHVDLLSFETLKATSLFKDFLHNDKGLSSFFHAYQFTDDLTLFSKEIATAFPAEKRAKLARLLTLQNKEWGASSATLQSIETLRKPESVVVATGHQLSLFGGPMFTVYKILSVIALSNNLKQDFNIDAVPVFWMADEDHDLPEVLDIGISHTDEAPYDPFFRSLEMDDQAYPVGRVIIPEKIKALLESLESQLEAPFTSQLIEFLQSAYHPGAPFKEAFAKLLLKWFGSFGLVLISADHPEFKSWALPVFKQAVASSEELYQSLEAQSEALVRAGYHRQVQFDRSHLFRYTSDGKRVKIRFQDGFWNHEQQLYTPDQLLGEMDANPEEFSPGVLLRLALQSHLLPVLTVVGGPAEIAYAAQSKPVFECVGLPMPTFQSRHSATILETNVKRNLDRLALPFSEYQNRLEELESMWLHEHAEPDMSDYFNSWKTELTDLHRRFASRIEQNDPTLTASSEKVLTAMKDHVDYLESKLRRSLKRQHETDLLRLRMVKQAVYPGNILQERQISAISFYAQHGPDLWSAILRIFEEKRPDRHLVLSFSPG